VNQSIEALNLKREARYRRASALSKIITKKIDFVLGIRKKSPAQNNDVNIS
jgi:hypothetical protein